MSSNGETNTFIECAEKRMVEYDAEADKHRKRGAKAPVRVRGLLPRRNESCPCGSGAKYKKCCRLRRPYA